MRIHPVALTDTDAFSSFFIDFIQQKEQLKDFYHRFPTLPNYIEQAKQKAESFPAANRALLQEVLLRQYSSIRLTPTVKHCIELLADKTTFTVTTGHQLNIFTGPLFFIYKIVTVVNICKWLKVKYPEYNFIPVYWMASEDHDYEEIKSFRLYGQKYTWETKQSGAVGRFDPSSISSLLDQIPGDITPFRNAYLKQKTLANAVRSYVNEYFSADGLLVIDGDDPALKALFRNVIHDDLFNHKPASLVTASTEKLEALGYHTQVHARDINLFYLDGNIRARIEKKGDSFHVVDTNLTFSAKEMEEMVKEHPERFSPNVILRPLYQEVILPNAGYVGGPAEVIYWLQLRTLFDHYKIPFPIVQPRNFAMVIESSYLKKWIKTDLTVHDLFREENYLCNHWVLGHTKNDLTVGKELDSLTKAFEELRKRASAVDPTLGPLVGAEGTRATHSLEKIEKKMLKAEKKLHSDRLRQIKEVKQALFPGGSLQERVDNFLGFYQKDPDFIARLISQLDPFAFHFNVITYD
jgi:bacillithiol biosynthesis cysteine-adding enzyme BshC